MKKISKLYNRREVDKCMEKNKAGKGAKNAGSGGGELQIEGEGRPP